MDCIYIAPLSKALYNLCLSFTHSPHIHTPTAIGCHARYQPARQEQLGVRCLAQGHFDTPRVGSNRQPSDCQTTNQTNHVLSIVAVSEKSALTLCICHIYVQYVPPLNCFSLLVHNTVVIHESSTFTFSHFVDVAIKLSFHYTQIYTRYSIYLKEKQEPWWRSCIRQ